MLNFLYRGGFLTAVHQGIDDLSLLSAEEGLFLPCTLETTAPGGANGIGECPIILC